MRMWPSYFHLPSRKLRVVDSVLGVVEADDNAPAENLMVGQTVRALTKIKWEGKSSGLSGLFSERPKVFVGKDTNQEDRVIEGTDGTKTKYKAYFAQFPEDSPEHVSSGSKYKVIAGDKGVVKSFEGQALLVHWDEYKNVYKLHSVLPSQIIGY